MTLRNKIHFGTTSATWNKVKFMSKAVIRQTLNEDHVKLLFPLVQHRCDVVYVKYNN